MTGLLGARVQRRRQTGSVSGRAEFRSAATLPGRVLTAGGQARRRDRLRGRLRLRRGVVRRPGAARHRADHADRGRRRAARRSPRSPTCPTLIDADTGFGEPMSAARTITAARGRRAGRLPHRGPGQPQAVRAPRRQGRRPDRGDGQAAAGGGGRAPRPELRHLRPHRRRRDRGPRRRDRAGRGLRRRRRRPDLHRGADRRRPTSRSSAPPWISRCWPT